MKNSMPIATVPRVLNTCCKSYSTAACLLIRRLSIGGNAFCIFPIGKDDAGRWCCINKREEPLTFRTIPGFQTRHLYTTFSRRYSRHKAVLRPFLFAFIMTTRVIGFSFPTLCQFSFPDKAMGEERFQMGF